MVFRVSKPRNQVVLPGDVSELGDIFMLTLGW